MRNGCFQTSCLSQGLFIPFPRATRALQIPETFPGDDLRQGCHGDLVAVSSSTGGKGMEDIGIVLANDVLFGTFAERDTLVGFAFRSAHFSVRILPEFVLVLRVWTYI